MAKKNKKVKKNQEWSLTVSEPRWVVIDVRQRDGHRGGAGEAAHLADHVLCLDDENVLVPCLSVHVGQSRSDDT